MVEFAAVLLPLILVLVGIIQFGFLFAAYVGVSNAAREGARNGTIYVYNPQLTQSANDVARCGVILATSQQSLDTGVPGQFSGSCATSAGGGDLHQSAAQGLPVARAGHLPTADLRSPHRRLDRRRCLEPRRLLGERHHGRELMARRSLAP